MRRILFYLTALLWLFSSSALATEYIFRDLMANTLPAAKCDEKSEALASALKSYNMERYSRKFCKTQGYGWHVDAVKDKGTPVCNECSSDKGRHQCYIRDVVVTCKRIKPGSVGMLPGQG